MVHRPPRPSLIPLVALAALFAAPIAALGHAELETMAPADHSSGPAPTRIVGTFAQNLDPAKSSFTVVDATGAVVAKGGELAADQLRTLTLALTTPLAAGAYTVRWTTVSTEDGETARGTTTFTVVAAAPPASPTPEPSGSANPSTGASGSPSAASLAPAPSPSAPPSAPAASSSDAVIPIVVALVLIAAVGAWLLRGRGRGSR